MPTLAVMGRVSIMAIFFMAATCLMAPMKQAE